MTFPHRLEINENSFKNTINIVNNLNLHFANIGNQNGSSLNFSSSSTKINSNSFIWINVQENEITNIIKS